MGRFLNGLAGLVGGILLFVLTLPFIGIGFFGSALSESVGGMIISSLWILFLISLVIGAPVYFWILSPLISKLKSDT